MRVWQQYLITTYAEWQQAMAQIAMRYHSYGSCMIVPGSCGLCSHQPQIYVLFNETCDVDGMSYHDDYNPTYASSLQDEHFSGYVFYRSLFNEETLFWHDRLRLVGKSGPAIHHGYMPAPEPVPKREAVIPPNILADESELEPPSPRPPPRQARQRQSETPSPVKAALPEDIGEATGGKGRRMIDPKRYKKGKKEVNYDRAIEYPNGPHKDAQGMCLTCCYNSRSCDSTDMVWNERKKVWRCAHCAKPDKHGMSTRNCYWKDEERGIFTLPDARAADPNGRTCAKNTVAGRLERARKKLAIKEEDEDEDEA